MLNIFRGKAVAPTYQLVMPEDGKLQSIIVSPEVYTVRRP